MSPGAARSLVRLQFLALQLCLVGIRGNVRSGVLLAVTTRRDKRKTLRNVYPFRESEL